MAKNTRIFIPRYISDVNYNPNKVIPHIYFYNGQTECEPWYLEGYTGSVSTSSAEIKQLAVETFPQLDYYSGNQVNSSSLSLLFNNEYSPYGEIPSESLYSKYWSKYIGLLYDAKTRLITCSGIIPLAQYFKIKLNDVVEWRGNYYYVRAINDYNISNGECNLQLLGPILDDTLQIEYIPLNVSTTTTTAGPTSTTTAGPTSTTTAGPTTTSTSTTSTSTTAAPTSTSTTTAAPGIVTTGLTLWNACDSLSGSIWLDKSGNGNNALVSGSALARSGSLGYRFVSSSNPNYLTYPANLTATPSSSYTLQFYGSVDDDTAQQPVLFMKSTGSWTDFGLGWAQYTNAATTNGRMYYLSNGGYPSFIENETYGDQLYTLTVNDTGDVMELFINTSSYGNAGGSSTIRAFNNSPDAPLTFGKGLPDNVLQSYRGTIRDIIVYNRVLSQAEINQNYFWLTSQSCEPATTTTTTSTSTTLAPVWYQMTACSNGDTVNSIQYLSGSFQIGNIVSFGSAYFQIVAGLTSAPSGSLIPITASVFSVCPATSTTTSTTTAAAGCNEYTITPVGNATYGYTDCYGVFKQIIVDTTTVSVCAQSSPFYLYGTPGGTVTLVGPCSVPTTTTTTIAPTSTTTFGPSTTTTAGPSTTTTQEPTTYCQSYTITAKANVNGDRYGYRDCVTGVYATNGLAAGESLTACYLSGSITDPFNKYTIVNNGSCNYPPTTTTSTTTTPPSVCESYTVVTGNYNNYAGTFGYYDCDDLLHTFTISTRGTAVTVCAKGSPFVISGGAGSTIYDNGVCPYTGSCVNGYISSNAADYVTYLDCNGLFHREIFGSTLNVWQYIGCVKSGSIKFENIVGSTKYDAYCGTTTSTTSTTTSGPTTTTTTIAPGTCLTYRATNNGVGTTSVTFVDCFNVSSSINVGAGTFEEICAKYNTPQSAGNVTFTILGNCSPSTSTTTSTSTTSTTTLAPDCYTYSLGRCRSTGGCTLSYTDCGGVARTYDFAYNITPTFEPCAKDGTPVSIKGTFDITKGAYCGAATTTTTTAGPTTTTTIAPTTTTTTTSGPTTTTTSGPTTTTTSGPTTTTTSTTSTSTSTTAAWYGYNLFPVAGGTCDATGDNFTAYKYLSGGSINNGDTLYASQNTGDPLVTGYYSDGGFRYEVNTGVVSNKTACPLPTTTTTISPTTSTTTAAGCDAMEFNFTPSTTVWSITGCQSVVTGSTHNYYIHPQRSGASLPQTFVYYASGSVNLQTPLTWVYSSSLQPVFTASVTWDNQIDSGTGHHVFFVTGSNCAGVSVVAGLQVTAYDIPVSC